MLRPPVTCRPAARPPCPGLKLPLAFEAFCSLNWERYLAYARVHLSERAAADLVRTALGDLVTSWHTVVALDNPTAYAWQDFAARTWYLSTPALRSLSGGIRYEARVLHQLLGYSIDETAEVMGEEPGRIRSTVTSPSPKPG